MLLCGFVITLKQPKHESLMYVYGILVFANRNEDVMIKELCLRNKTSVPVFYIGNKTWVQVWVRMN